MFGIGVPELILILIIGLVVFGPGKLPEVGRAVGRSIKEFRRASSAITDAVTGDSSPTVPQAAQENQATAAGVSGQAAEDKAEAESEDAKGNSKSESKQNAQNSNWKNGKRSRRKKRNG
ncbi:MAG: twin-arginine translocase TatA/TatE family subunit [Schwartzia sp.]|nr:twin-arginine translocase TatA/TatE family subunit [Schwartzia sp. (in: firmicutes)]